MVVIVCDCCTISLIAIFLCLGYIHFGAKVHTIFQMTKRVGVAFRFFSRCTLQIRILYAKSARKLAENCQKLGFR